MDFGINDGLAPSEPYTAFEPARYALGDTRRYAERMNLAAMTPQGMLSSTGHALASSGPVQTEGSSASPASAPRDAAAQKWDSPAAAGTPAGSCRRGA